MNSSSLRSPPQDGWQAALSTGGGVYSSMAFWTTAVEESLLALACQDIILHSLLPGAALPVAPSNPP